MRSSTLRATYKERETERGSEVVVGGGEGAKTEGDNWLENERARVS